MRYQFISVKSVIEGLLTFLPGFKGSLNKKTGGTNAASYCYSVWLRHHSKIVQTLRINLAGSHIAELGPGDSLGVGIAALLSGCGSYTAIDTVQHFNTEINLAVLDELHWLFAQKSPIPNQDELPLVKPLLDNYSFPSFLNLNSSHLSQDRKAKIAASLKYINHQSSLISFLPAESTENFNNNSFFDLILSQAALEHVNDLPSAYAMCSKWLKPGGVMSHTIDFKCHGAAKEWNGHWAYPTFLWHILMGRRTYFINRQPLSVHLRLLDEHGFDIILLEKFHQHSTLTRSDLAKDFFSLTEEDITTAGAYILAQKRL